MIARQLVRLFILALLLVSACAPLSTALPHPALTARATAHDNPAQHVIQLTAESNVPLVSAQLLYGAEGGRTPINVPLTPNAQFVTYPLDAPSTGLRLPRGASALRYSWTLRSASGETLTLSQSISSTQLISDTAPLPLTWQEARRGNISLYDLPNTPAARDRDWLQQIAAEAIAHVEGVLDTRLDTRLSVYLVPRIFWQGGAAFGGKVLFISYADRPYTGVTARDYLAHEGAHALTMDWGNIGAAGGLLAEGIAVYATGGHYQPDLLDESAVALAQSSLFIAPTILRRDFSNQQHEIAYTESGSFVKYLIEHYGLDKFRALMRRPNDWRNLYDKDFDALTQEWLTTLRSAAVPSSSTRRWQLKVRYYDLMRQYEERFDPAARRLPSVPLEKWDALLREALSAPADGEDNRVLELMMFSAIEAIENTRDDGPLDAAEALLNEIEHTIKAPTEPEGAQMQKVRAVVQFIALQDQAILNRDWDALRATLDTADHPQFAAQYLEQARTQPAWLSFTQSPASLVLGEDQAWLTVAQWGELLDASQAASPNGQRWVLSLRKVNGAWRLTGRWPDSPSALMSR